MNTVIVKINDATQTVNEVEVVTKDGTPTVIKAVEKVNYEFHDNAINRAPNHIVTKRIENDLHVSFDEEGKESDLIIEGFYDHEDSALVGIAEDGEYYYYIPDTGETYDYVTQLEAGDVEGQALGGEAYVAAAIPWWIPAAAGIGLVGLLASKNSSGRNSTAPVAEDDTQTGISGNPVVIDILGNDTDHENDIDPTTVKLIDPVTGDEVTTVTVEGEGSWAVDPVTGDITFTPEAGFTGDPTPISYTVDNRTGETSNEATVTIEYPQAVNDTQTGASGSPVVVAVVGNDGQGGDDLDPATVMITQSPAGGTIADDGKSVDVPGEGSWAVDPVTGDITFTPEAGFTGDPTPISYTVDNRTGETSNEAT
ncbi:Ig-like domain-containing protein, partial [Psychrobacter sp. APC 3279]|uniref:Ig-like domain-containing protein n=1 Tax=Psychrobacter sp. APC 3279 TaxID=3035189 RepID=UPI0025B5896D